MSKQYDNWNPPIPSSPDRRICDNCGAEYKGIRCPSCGRNPQEVRYIDSDDHGDSNVGR